MARGEHKRLFYIVDEENHPFYEWLRIKYKGENIEIFHNSNFDSKHIKKFYPRSKVSLFIISFLELNHRNIKNFLEQNPRFSLPFILHLAKEKNKEEDEFVIPWVYIGKYFKNGIEINKHDYLRYIENFIDTVITAEEEFIRRCFKNVNDSRAVFHSVKIETKGSLHFFREFQQFFRENYELMEDTTAPEIDIEPLTPSVDRFEVELPQIEIPDFVRQTPEDYFEIIEANFDIKEYIESLLRRVKDFLYDQYRIIKEIWVIEKDKLWKKHNEELIKKINNQYIRFKSFLKETKKIKYLRLKVYETLYKIKESKKNLSISQRQLFAESSFRSLLKDNFDELKQRIQKLFKYKRWRLYLIATLSISLILSLLTSILSLEHYGFLHKFLAIFVVSFLVVFSLFWLLRHMLIKKQYQKVNLLLKEIAEELNRKIKENLEDFHDFMNEVIRKEILKQDYEFLINVYKDILGVLDNYIHVFRHFDEFLLSMSQDTPILISTETSIKPEMEKPEKELIGTLEMFPSLPSRSLLYNSVFNVMLNTYKGYVGDTKLESENLENRISNAFKIFWEYFPSKEQNGFYPVKGVIVSPLKEAFRLIPTQLQNVLEGKLAENYDSVLITCFLKRK